ncbi:hypothetical protein ASPZODRAFT_55674 [Penicilliopsis zonata CBS 506.65]|uniref:54S ribosomal protein L28, mitochondrial n=1 Tax=Penicilliopsis zonata CBS 506.65 TaxID=1073090 RepID=A0A1L9SWB5_9EURO|nr:hypothetical protein ASPZODRAFT_55674 [Penicilliopsis zonata CBS 506.65]OJJ51495.1 hypothetical protein ASPZODRAFT_55674 [Penicilliopsis zonata CBS 506.65]
MRLSPVLASLASVFRIPLRPTQSLGQPLPRSFSSTPSMAKKQAAPKDKKITMIRYFLWHPLTPRPLRFSRNRYLRHWTIHRAWQLYTSQQRRKGELELQRQWQAMSAACEELRTGAGDGGRLFRLSMNKKGVFRDMFPIEYGRLQTETPSKEGWNHAWKRIE